tara:strand:- start:1132 stop:1683 length:552 start_codon:yes stop_codon:yes gene_type:complete
MSTLKANSIKHASSSSNNIVLNSNGTITATNTNSLAPAIASGAGSGNTSDRYNYQDIVTATITPNSSTSDIMVIATGIVLGKQGNNQNNRSVGGMQMVRGNTVIGDSVQSSGSGDHPTAGGGIVFSQTFHDTNNHGGSAQTYKLQLKKITNSNTGPNVLMGGYSSTTNNTQGNARLLLVEVMS